jgi:tetratricopeptide (TPR) repeat protein
VRHESAGWGVDQAATCVLVASFLLVGTLAGCGSGDPLERAQPLLAEGRFEEALEPLREAVQADPEDPEIQFLYGAALWRSGRPSMAVWSLRKASEHPEWSVRAGLELGASAMQARNWEAAIEAADRVLTLEPDNLRAVVLRAEARLGAKQDLEAALADYERALEVAPEDVRLKVSRAAALLLLKRLDEVQEAIAELQGGEGANALDEVALARLCTTRAVFANEKRDFDEAELLFEKCLEEFPVHGVVLDAATDFFDARGRPERATEALRAAVEAAPVAAPYRITLARRMRAAGDFEQSEEVLRAGLEIPSPELRSLAWAALADHYVAADDLDAAAAAYEKSFQLKPEPSTLEVLTLADIFARAGWNERALEVAERLDNDTYRGLVEARVHLNEGRPRAALARLDGVLAAWPDNPGARYYAARAAEQIGDFDRAIAEYRQSIRSRADFTEAGLRLARLHEAEGADLRAWAAASHHKRAHPDEPEGAVLLLRLASRMGPETRLRSLLRDLRGRKVWPRAIALRADAVALRAGPEAAIEMLRGAPGIDLERPGDADALRSLCVHLVAAGRMAEADAALQAALAAHPDVGAFHEVRGLLLEQRGASSGDVRDAYERAVELAPRNGRALEALGRLSEEADDLESALRYYGRAAAANPNERGPLRRAATLLAAAGRTQEAEAQWEALLLEHPYDAAAAMQLVRLRLDRQQEGDRTLELARRAVRFRGGSEARQLLARVHRARGEEALAATVEGELQESSAAGPAG